jgi:hypothetical protein
VKNSSRSQTSKSPKSSTGAEGFNKSGKSGDAVVDVDQTDKLVPVLVAECAKTPKESLSKAVQRHASVAPKPVAPFPRRQE